MQQCGQGNDNHASGSTTDKVQEQAGDVDGCSRPKYHLKKLYCCDNHNSGCGAQYKQDEQLQFSITKLSFECPRDP